MSTTQRLETRGRAVIGTAKRNRHLVVPRCIADVIDRLHATRMPARRVVHDGIQLAEPFDGGADGVLHVGRARDVCGDGDRRRNGVGKLRSLVTVAAGGSNDDMRSSVRADKADGAAEAGAAAGDENNLAVKVARGLCHGVIQMPPSTAMV